MFGLVAQLAISVIGCPLNGTGLGVTVTWTAPAPVPGDGDGEGAGLGVGDGVGVGVPALFEREGTPLLVTGVGEVGSTDPQSIVTNAIASEAMTMGMRIRRDR